MYTAKAYLHSNYIGLMDSIESTNIHDCVDFIWSRLQHGYYCTLQYNTNSYLYRYFSPVYFDEITEDISDCEVELIGGNYRSML